VRGFVSGRVFVLIGGACTERVVVGERGMRPLIMNDFRGKKETRYDLVMDW
jgi:hypothetical protein